MATIKIINDGTEGSFLLSPEELLDIRKHALHCASRYSAERGYDVEDLLRFAKRFEEHLTRNAGNG